MDHLGKLVLMLPDRREEEFILTRPNIVLGRDSVSDIVLADARVSRAHARLEFGADGYSVVDLDSANGVSLNGKKVSRAVLEAGDVINLGNSSLRFEIAPSANEDEEIVINSEADLDATLARATVPMTLTNTEVDRLIVHTPQKTWELPLNQMNLLIGRDENCDLVLDYGGVSRQHARLEREGQGFLLRDLDSTNGTWLGAGRIEIHHLKNGDTLRIGDAHLVFKNGFAAADLTFFEEQGVGSKFLRQPVVFVPGMMGSELWRGSEKLWPNVKLLFTDPEICSLKPDDGVEPRGIVSEVVIVPNLIKQQRYSRVGDYLEEGLGYKRGENYLEFAYDWRQDNRLSAQRLAEAIEGWPVTPPITIIAHSLGCLVSRYYVERLGGKNKVGRLILLGGPHEGYPRAISHLLQGPDLLPFGLLGERLRQVISSFSSLYQILPTSNYVSDQAGSAIDLFADDSWLPEPRRPLLLDAREFWRELGRRSAVPTVSIFGYGLKTITGVNVNRNSAGVWKNVELDQSAVGDADIPETSAVLEGSEIHPVHQHHGSLYVDHDVKMRLKIELVRQRHS